jgi:AcrR family transcriptional regulator
MKKTAHQQRQANTKQAILQTALALITEKGLDKLSLREIARRVEYSPAGLYEYFDGKDDILRALARQGDARLRAAFERISHDLPLTERLIQICLAYVDFVIYNSEYFTVMNSIPSNYTSLDQPAPRESSYFIFLQAVQNMIDAGEITPREGFNREEITYSLWAMAHGMGMLRLNQLRDFEADFETANRRAFEIVIAGLK